MSDAPSPLQRIEANVQLVLATARDQFGLTLACDRDGAAWLHRYIEQQHQQGDPNLHGQLASVLGSFLGQCVIQSHGGSWQETEGQWAVVFSPGNAVYPFEKTRKHLTHGQANGDGVLPFFDAIPALFLPQTTDPSRAFGWRRWIKRLSMRASR